MTPASLEKRLRWAFECSRIVWRKPPDSWARIDADAGKFFIRLPPDKDDDYTLRGLFHELCHVAIPGELGAFGSFEEDILERVLEPQLMDHVLQRPKKHEWWMKKLREARDAKRSR